jgi:catechol 2,3-dioxygenase-like lactoylglutathione lyase family enzyme
VSLLGGVHHVSLNVDDAEVAARFYEDVLGLTRIERPDFGIPGVWLSAGAVQIHLIEIEGHTAPEGQHFAFQVDDVDAVQARLVEQDVDATVPSSFPGAGRQSFLHDPAGNLIELNQPESPA